ncbi:MAG TPA: Asr1405/Asl0597 family protein [Candidatus Obscuribacterales bacterium]
MRNFRTGTTVSHTHGFVKKLSILGKGIKLIDNKSQLWEKMNPLELDPAAGEIVEVNRADRWQVYLRLQQLDIPCKCATNQPLQVQIQSVAAGFQLWSVVRQLTAPRRELAFWLERCWQLCPYSDEDLENI